MFIVAAKRTPFGAYGGLLKDFSATDLTEFAARAALSAGKVPPETIDSVIVGNVMQVSGEGGFSYLLLALIIFLKIIPLLCHREELSNSYQCLTVITWVTFRHLE